MIGEGTSVGVPFDDKDDEESEGTAYGVDTEYAAESIIWLLYGWYVMEGGLYTFDIVKVGNFV